MEHTVIIIRIERRLKVESFDTMSQVLSENEIELSKENLEQIIGRIRYIFLLAFKNKFSFINKGDS